MDPLSISAGWFVVRWKARSSRPPSSKRKVIHEDLSYDEVAAILGRVLERPVQYREASANQYVHTLVGRGASTEYARSRVDIFAEWAQGITRAEPRGPGSASMMGFATWAKSECSRLVPRRDTAPGEKACSAESCCC